MIYLKKKKKDFKELVPELHLIGNVNNFLHLF